MADQGRHLHVLVAVPVEVARSIGRQRLPDTEVAAAHGRPHVVRHQPGGDHRPIGHARFVEGVRLPNPDMGRLAPQARRPVQRADHDRDDQERQQEGEPPRAEDAEELEAFEKADDTRPERRLQAGSDRVHLLGIVGRAAQGDRGKLGEDDPDHARQRDPHDLQDGEPDRGKEPVDAPPGPRHGVRRPARDERRGAVRQDTGGGHGSGGRWSGGNRLGCSAGGS